MICPCWGGVSSTWPPLRPAFTDGTAGSGGAINFISNGSRNSTADILMDGVSATGFEQNSGINDPSTPPR